MYLPKIENKSDYLGFKRDAIQLEWKNFPPPGLSDFTCTILLLLTIDDKSECITFISDEFE